MLLPLLTGPACKLFLAYSAVLHCSWKHPEGHGIITVNTEVNFTLRLLFTEIWWGGHKNQFPVFFTLKQTASACLYKWQY